MRALEGKVAVITGGTRGFGLGMARAFIIEGAQVVVGSRSTESVARAVADLDSRGGNSVGKAVDVVDLTQVQDLANFALEKFQRLDIWINNAGLPGPYGPTVHTPVDRFIEVSRTNIFGTYNGSLVAMRHFLGIGGGKLINILGRGTRGPQPMQNAYASSKAWILRFTQALAEEYKGSGVGVYAFSPGMMDTEMLLDVEFIEGYEQRAKVLPTVMRFLSQPVEVPARKAVWLASASTDGKTGLVVHELTMRKMVIHALGIGLNRLFHRPGRTYDLKIRTIPAAYPPINHLG